MKFYLIFTCTVQNNRLLLLFLFSLHIITFLIYYFIHIYLIYLCLHMVLFSKMSDLPVPYIYPPYTIHTSVASRRMRYIFSLLFSLHNHSRKRDSTVFSLPFADSVSVSFSFVPSFRVVHNHKAFLYPPCFTVAIPLVLVMLESPANLSKIGKAFLITSRSHHHAKHFFVKLLLQPCLPLILL